MVDHDGVRRAHGYHTVRVKDVVQETHDTRSYVLDVTDAEAGDFHYRAGQFCTFRVHTGGEEHMRCYSMSSAPETDADLTVTVKRVPGGLVSNWFHDHVAAGDTLEVTRPAGTFCLTEGDRPVVGFCGGSGVTPVISIAKSALATTGRALTIVYANRDAQSVIFDEAWRELAERHPARLAVHHHLDSEGGFLDRAAVAAFVAGRLDADFYICGPGPFMDLVESTLLDLGVPAERIAIERFTAADNPAVAIPDEEPAADAADGVPGEVTIILKGKRHTITYMAGDTLLATARRGGLAAPFSCESGNCATCMALLREGTATMRANNALTEQEVAEGWVLTCQGLPHGRTVTVEYEDL